jgi:hypothetical protein
MNIGLPDNPENRLDAFLDGTLSGDGVREMKARIANEPELKREAELQAQIDASLRRCCKAPDVEVLLRKANGSMKPARSQPGLLYRIGRIAAMVVIGVTVVLAVMWFVDPGGRPGDRTYEVLGLEDSYLQLVGDGLTPEWRCETDEEFAATYRSRLGQALVLGSLPPGVEALGLSYSPAFSFNTVALLARVDGQPVIVYADYAHAAGGVLPTLPAAPNVHVFERRIGDIVLYEVTPKDKPAILGAMVVPEDAAGCATQ